MAVGVNPISIWYCLPCFIVFESNQHPPGIYIYMDPYTSQIAREQFGISYLFPYQELVVSNILEASESGEQTFQIVILPTGAGKSLCFTLPGMIIQGITIIIFPLLSLMQDQYRRMQEASIPAAVLRGGQDAAFRRKEITRLSKEPHGFILTNPETLASPQVLQLISGLSIAHVVIDEVHTVTQWGETFRPAYLPLGNLIHVLNPRIVTAFTATVSPASIPRLKQLLFKTEDVHVIRGNPDRSNITYQVVPTISANHDLTRYTCPKSGIPRPALVFCPTRNSTEKSAELLAERHQDSDIRYYHAGLEPEKKKELEEWFFASRNGILCCTTAYGMGIDKPNIRGVIHLHIPDAVESFLQETGRAGRDGELSRSVSFIPQISRDEESLLAQALRKNGICRREMLLDLMGSPCESCTGCDVCSSQVPEYAQGFKEITEAVSRSSGRLDAEQWIRVLRRDAAPWGHAWWRYPGAGSLSHWRPEDLRTAVHELYRAGILKSKRRGLWKNLLYVNSQ